MEGLSIAQGHIRTLKKPGKNPTPFVQVLTSSLVGCFFYWGTLSLPYSLSIPMLLSFNSAENGPTLEGGVMLGKKAIFTIL